MPWLEFILGEPGTMGLVAVLCPVLVVMVSWDQDRPQTRYTLPCLMQGCPGCFPHCAHSLIHCPVLFALLQCPHRGSEQGAPGRWQGLSGQQPLPKARLGEPSSQHPSIWVL